MLVTATPAGIEKFFEEAFNPAVEGKEPPPVTPELMARLMAASARHGQTVPATGVQLRATSAGAENSTAHRGVLVGLAMWGLRISCLFHPTAHCAL